MSSFHAASRPPRLWAIGGGKGGIGKTVVASSLALAFAHRGRRCVVVDADLGAANLHTVLGVERPARTLDAFMCGEVETLDEVACGTSHPNLRVVTGAGEALNAANPHHTRKQRLLRHLRRFDADEVITDLSAGSSFNVLDFFVEADLGIAVLTPEPTAIENAYQFLKAAWFRSLRPAVHRPGVREIVHEVIARRQGRPRSPLGLIAEVCLMDEEAGRALADQARCFAPKLLLNQASRPAHRRLGARIVEDCRVSLGAALEDLGSLSRDESVGNAVQEGRPVFHAFPRSAFVEDLETLVDRLFPLPPPRQITLLDALLGGGDVSRPGAVLRRRREQLGLALAALERRTRIRSLERLENESFDRLPPEAYVRGYVLQYARELGIREADALVESFVARYRESRRGDGSPPA